jgi:hypothetical protein
MRRKADRRPPDLLNAPTGFFILVFLTIHLFDMKKLATYRKSPDSLTDLKWKAVEQGRFFGISVNSA